MIKTIKTILYTIFAVLFMLGWGPSGFSWLYVVFHNWSILPTSGWLVATLLLWMIANIIWTILVVFVLLFGALDTGGNIPIAIIIFITSTILGVTTLGILIYFLGW